MYIKQATIPMNQANGAFWHSGIDWNDPCQVPPHAMFPGAGEPGSLTLLHTLHHTLYHTLIHTLLG